MPNESHETMLNQTPSVEPLGACAQRVHIVDLGSMEYASAFDQQRAWHEQTLALRESSGASGARCFGALLLVEHRPPVITISRRPGVRDHLTATEEQLQQAGVTVSETDRGGDITYHGPGQLVVYPILDSRRLGKNLHAYMRLLEEIVINVCARFGVRGERDASATGVWVDGAKVCAMGVRVRRWVTMHGLALNVDPDMTHFDLIVPCGLAGRRVTSLRRLLGDRAPTMDQAKSAIVSEFESALESGLNRGG